MKRTSVNTSLHPTASTVFCGHAGEHGDVNGLGAIGTALSEDPLH